MRTGYKQTPLGEIPEEWDVVELAEIGDKESDIVAGPFGSNLKVSDYKPEGVPIIRLQNIGRNNFIDKDLQYVSQEKAEELSYHSFIAGDIVLAKLGDPIGKTCIAPEYLKSGIVVADVVRIRPSKFKAHTKYLEYILNSRVCYRQLRKEVIGSTRPWVNISQIRKLKIVLPLLEEQKRIAEVLSTVDDAIQRVEEAVTKTGRLKQGLMQKLLSEGIGHTEFKDTSVGRIPKTWDVVKIEDLTNSYAGGTPSRRYQSYYSGDILWVKSGEVSKGEIYDTEEKITEAALRDSSARYVPENTVLVAMYGATAGKVGILKKKATTNQAVLALVPQKEGFFDYRYLYHQISSRTHRLINTTQGTGQPNLSKKLLDKIKIVLPPLEEQKKIAEILSTVDRKRDLERERKTTLERIKKGLMNDLLTGKKRVKVGG